MELAADVWRTQPRLPLEFVEGFLSRSCYDEHFEHVLSLVVAESNPFEQYLRVLGMSFIPPHADLMKDTLVMRAWLFDRAGQHNAESLAVMQFLASLLCTRSTPQTQAIMQQCQPGLRLLSRGIQSPNPYTRFMCGMGVVTVSLLILY